MSEKDRDKAWLNDHERGCQGREYVCTCGYDDERDAEIKRLTEALAQARKALEVTDEQIIDLAVCHSNYKDTHRSKKTGGIIEYEVISHGRIVEFGRALIALITDTGRTEGE